MDHETNKSIELLLSECNRDESFRKSLVSLLGTETPEEFELIVTIAKKEMSESMLPFIYDLRALYDDPLLRTVMLGILDDDYSESKMRAVSYILNMHLAQIRRVEDLRSMMYKNARDTIEQYVPAFDELVDFIHRLETEHLDEATPHPALSDVFYKELLDSLHSDTRVTSGFLENICRDESFRSTIDDQIESYPEVVQVLFRMADALVRAQRYLADMEIDNLLHGIEESCSESNESENDDEY